MNTIQFIPNKNGIEICNTMDAVQCPAGANRFELRMFLVDIGNGQREWCGSLQNVKEGVKHYFKGWSGLVASLDGILTPLAQLEVLRALEPVEVPIPARLHYLI
jgi:hypothetical protein